MHVPNRHILQQGPVLGALGRTALLALGRRVAGGPAAIPSLPGPEHRRVCKPLPRSLIEDYVRHLGGDPRAYRGTLPPHLFPQWCMPLLARTLEDLPYPLLRVVNGGCRIEVRSQLPDDEPLEVSAQLTTIDQDERRAVLAQRVITGTKSSPEALAIDFNAVVPLSRGGGEDKRKRPASDRARAPVSARELAFWELEPGDALAYAKLTGDFNPIHWVAPYARISGFQSVILHGFATLARAWEGMNKSLFGGDVSALTAFDVKLTRPLALPHRVGLYCDGDGIFVANGPGGAAYLTGRFTRR